MLEAMANGIPVISTDFSTGAARQLIGENERGLLIPVGDREKLTLAMAECLTHMDLAEKRAEKHYDLSTQTSHTPIRSNLTPRQPATPEKHQGTAGAWMKWR